MSGDGAALNVAAPSQDVHRHEESGEVLDDARQAELRSALNSISHVQLRPLSLGLALLYAFFAAVHPFTLPADISGTMTVTAAATMVVLAGLWTYVRRIPPASERVHWLTAALTLLVLINSVLHLYLSGEPRQTSNIILVIVATGYLILSTRLFAAVLVTSVGAWVAIALVLPVSNEWVHYAFALLQATLISMVVHGLRVRATRRAELMRLREVWRRDELEEAKERAEEVARLKSAFLANMSHEIRTPLTGILGFTEIMEDQAKGDMKRLTRIIRRNGERLLETINSVLDLARLEAGKMTMETELVNVAHAVHPVADFFRTLADKNGLDLSVDVKEPDAWIDIDTSCLLRIQSNLIGNAIKFTENGEVAICVDATSDGVQLTVRDTGIGIEHDFLPYLFEEFRQASTGLARSHEGSGLGLAITRRLVELAGGSISVNSEVGRGTAFTVSFPRVEPDQYAPPIDLNAAAA